MATFAIAWTAPLLPSSPHRRGGEPSQGSSGDEDAAPEANARQLTSPHEVVGERPGDAEQLRRLDNATVLTLDAGELTLAVRLQSRRPEDLAWRRSLGAKARRLDAGESASIAIAVTRSLGFASDDEDALTLWRALSDTPGRRTRDLIWQLVTDGIVAEHDAREVYRVLQSDDLHDLGGPPW